MCHFDFKIRFFENEAYVSGDCLSSDKRFSFHDFFQAYITFLKSHSIGLEQQVFLRLFLSDIGNQYNDVYNFLRAKCFVFYVGQPPANNSKYSIQSYFVIDRNCRIDYDCESNISTLSHGNFTTTYYSFLSDHRLNVVDQVIDILSRQQIVLNARDLSIQDNLHRTWFYVRDVDNNYSELVVKRKAFFDTIGLTAQTHYISSTGIEARMPYPACLFALHSLSVGQTAQGQVEYLSAPEFLGRTDAYGVTFERGTVVSYGDRAHYYISGTASIDMNGDVLYVDDPEKQTVRALENIRQLLRSRSVDLSSIISAIVYLRDRGDYYLVKKIVDHHLSEQAVITYVEGAVCRPSWLVEIEVVAITNQKSCAFKAWKS